MKAQPLFTPTQQSKSSSDKREEKPVLVSSFQISLCNFQPRLRIHEKYVAQDLTV